MEDEYKEDEEDEEEHNKDFLRKNKRDIILIYRNIYNMHFVLKRNCF